MKITQDLIQIHLILEGLGVQGLLQINSRISINDKRLIFANWRHGNICYFYTVWQFAYFPADA